MRIFVCLAALLAACTTEADTGTEHAIRPETSGAGIVFGKGCSTSQIGPKALTGRRAESIPFGDFPFPVRVVKPGMAVTMDYSDARLTVQTDAKGIITGYSCG